jgi:hypothetical protein
MDFFGNVQNVEVEAGGEFGGNETGWKEDLVRLGEMVREARRKRGVENGTSVESPEVTQKVTKKRPLQSRKNVGAVKVEAEQGWGKKITGAWALLGCAAVWFAGSVLT